MDPSSARVGDRVSVFQYGSGEPAHATLTELPGTMRVAAKWGGRESTEPTLHFVNGESAGMNRYVRWERVFPGWLERDGWQPWKG
jgi:hypothetical protein